MTFSAALPSSCGDERAVLLRAERLCFSALSVSSVLEGADGPLGEKQGDGDERQRQRDQPQVAHGTPPLLGLRIRVSASEAGPAIAWQAITAPITSAWRRGMVRSRGSKVVHGR